MSVKSVASNSSLTRLVRTIRAKVGSLVGCQSEKAPRGNFVP